MPVPATPPAALAPKTIHGKQFIVYGFGVTGRAIATFVLDHGGKVAVFDDAPELRFDPGILGSYRKQGVTFHFEPNGHDWLRSISSVGAILPSPGIALDRLLLDMATQSRVEILSELDLAASYFPGAVIAVTGTNGKSTITAWTHHLLLSAGKDSRIGGNYGTPACATVVQATDDTLGVWEVSSYQLEHSRRFHPKVAIFANLTEDHIARHGSLDEYRAVKERVFQRQGTGDSAILNADDPEVVATIARLTALPEGPSVLTYSLSDQTGAAGIADGKLWIRIDGTPTPLLPSSELPIQGPHNLSNALAVALAGHASGLSTTQIIASLKSFKGLPHRLTHIQSHDGLHWVNDSKSTNPASTLAALEAMTAPYVLILGGAEKGLDYHAMYDRMLQNAPSLVITMGPVGDRMATELQPASPPLHVLAVKNLAEAVTAARAHAKEGDTILLSPGAPSFNEFKNFEERGERFEALVLAEAAVVA